MRIHSLQAICKTIAEINSPYSTMLYPLRTKAFPCVGLGRDQNIVKPMGTAEPVCTAEPMFLCCEPNNWLFFCIV